MTIKTKLLLSTVLSTIGLGILIMFNNISLNNLSELKDAQTYIEKLNSDMLMLRRNEKDFLSRKDIKYKNKFKLNVEILSKDSKELVYILNSMNLNEETKEVHELMTIINDYEHTFFKIIKKQAEIGIHSKDALYGSLRTSVHKVQTIAKSNNNPALLASIYSLRKHEKDFMLRKDLKYLKKFNKEINILLSTSNDKIITYLESYKNDFTNLVKAEKIIGLTSKSGFKGEMRKTIHKSEVLLKTIESELSEIIVDKIKSEKLVSYLIAISIIIFIIAFLTFISRNIIKSINIFQIGLLDFFKYLNREKDNISLLDDSSKDEIALMAEVVNENIKTTQKGIEEDRAFIDETISVLSEFEQGDLCKRISTDVKNPALNELKKVLDSMGCAMEKNIQNVLSVLEQYSNYNYLNKVDNANVKNELLQLANGVNSLGDSITSMLIENKQVGLTLNASSETLLKNVEILNDTSTEASSSIEETAAALEEITSTIASNTDSVTEMAMFANKVVISIEEGNDLAKQTTKSMEEINEQVTAINDSIGVIDQIAFQTNILSLNAAVEAATAGEAGKGFAVVAQEVRNLASRSAEAAKEIKELVENANVKTNDGKKLSEKMIHGYTSLNKNISKTIELITHVEEASKEQRTGIEQINDAVSLQDQQTQKIAIAANETNDIAIHSSSIAKKIVDNVDANEFEGKDDLSNRRDKLFNLSYIKDQETAVKLESSSKKAYDIENNSKLMVQNKNISNMQNFEDKGNKEEWESF